MNLFSWRQTVREHEDLGARVSCVIPRTRFDDIHVRARLKIEEHFFHRPPFHRKKHPLREGVFLID